MKGDARVIEISGKVSSGLGKAQKFLMKKGYIEQMEEKLSFTPYPGTLNIDVSESSVRLLKEKEGILIKGFQEEGKTFGEITAFKAEINGMECAVIVPKLSTHTNKIEIIAGKELRKHLELKDGDTAKVRIFLS